jgi:tetratricopeptide (TPR) repeat protein
MRQRSSTNLLGGRAAKLVAAVVLALTAPLWAKFGVFKTSVHYVVHHPPGFVAFGHQVRLEVTSLDEGAGWGVVPRIRQSLEQGLLRANLSVTPKARTLFECSLTSARAHLETEARRESVNVHVGEHTVEEKNGKTKQVEDCKYQSSRVTYLVSSGYLAMQVRAVDAAGQTLMMSQAVERSYRMESPIAGPPQCGGKSYASRDGQLNSSDRIMDLLADQASGDALTLAVGYDETREVNLEVDEELKSGNALAKAGDWPDALSAWTEAVMKSAPAQAARQYNLGVAHQALAAAAARGEEFQDATSHLDQAQECFTQALKLDPSEKYFRETLARVQADRDLLRKAMEQASQEQSPAPNASPQGSP